MSKPGNVSKIFCTVVNSVDPDQMLHSAASALCLYHLLRPVMLLRVITVAKMVSYCNIL